MSVVRTDQLLTSYANFLAAQQTEDHFSKKLRELYDKMDSAVSNMTKEQLEKIDIFLNIIKNDTSNKKQEIEFFLENLKEKEEFENFLPYFKYFSLTTNNFSEFFKISDIEKSYSQFEKLAKKLFPNVFTSDKKLKAFFISLFSFDRINPESIGLYNIDVLEKIFIDNLLNYSSKTEYSRYSRKTFNNFLTDYFNQDAFGLQFQNMIGQAKNRNEPLFSEATFLNFNCKLWFDEFDKVKSYDLSAFLNFVGSDSFGSFAVFPDRENDSFSSLGTSDSTGNIINKNRLRCFVFPKVKMENGSFIDILRDSPPYFNEITFDTLSSRTHELLSKLIDQNPGFKIFYNVTPKQNMSISIDKKRSLYELQNTNSLYTNPPDMSFMAGGSSKKNKMKGGSVQNLFETSQSPSVIFDRPLKNYDKDSFFECVKKLQGLATLKQITGYLNDLLNNLIDSKNIIYPVVYTEGYRDFEGNPQNLGVFNISTNKEATGLNYENIRFLFLFSSIFTTFIKLFNCFFTFLSKTYALIIEYYEKSQKQSSAKNRNQNITYWFNQISKFQNLLKTINSISKILQLSIMTKDEKNKFFGFNLKFYELFLNNNEDNYNQALDTQINLYETVIDLVCNGLIEIETGGTKKLSLKPNIFFKSLQQFGKLFKIDFGGIPLISDKPQIQNSIIESYKYFVRYLYACQKSFIAYAQYHNSEKNVKASKNVIQDIEANVTHEIEELKSTTNIIDKCKIILKKVLEKFISKLHEIHSIYSRYKNNSSPESRGINNSNSKNKELKKKLGEFKIYIAIIEKSLQKLLNPIKNTLDTQTLELFMMGRFNNFSALLEYVILNIRSKPIKELLYPMGIEIDFDRSNHRVDVNKLFALLEDKFFRLKPNLSKNFKILLQNTGFYYRSPSFENIEWWVQIMDNFRDRDSGKRLFILGTLRRFGITNKIGVDDPVLIDVESCALVPVGEEIPTKKFLDIDYTVDKKTGKITEMRYQPAKNTIINLTPFLRYIREGYTRFIKKQSVSREDRGRVMKALIKKFEFRNTNGNNKTPLSTIGNIIRLLKGKLKNNAGIEIKPVILQAANPNQLAEIIRSRILDKRTANITYSSNQSRMDYQLIRLDKNNLKDSSLFRKFLSRVLFSSPESYNSPEVALEFNLFNLFQVGLSSKYFTTSFGKGSLVIDFFTALQPDDLDIIIGKFQSEMITLQKQNNKMAIFKNYALEIAEKMKLINQQELQKLLIEREVNYVNVNNKRKRKKMNNNQESEYESLFRSRRQSVLNENTNQERLLNTSMFRRQNIGRVAEQRKPNLIYMAESYPAARKNRNMDYSIYTTGARSSFATPSPLLHSSVPKRNEFSRTNMPSFAPPSSPLLSSVPPNRAEYSRFQVPPLSPVRTNKSTAISIYEYMQKNHSDFINYISKPDNEAGKIFLEFSKTLHYIPAFKCTKIYNDYQFDSLSVILQYEITFTEYFKIVFGNTFGTSSNLYCFCNLSSEIKQFIKGRVPNLFATTFNNNDIVYLQRSGIIINQNNDNKNYKLVVNPGLEPGAQPTYSFELNKQERRVYV
jgi:hypothetical protein